MSRAGGGIADFLYYDGDGPLRQSFGAVTRVSVPEPATFLLFTLTLVGLIVRRRSR